MAFFLIFCTSIYSQIEPQPNLNLSEGGIYKVKRGIENKEIIPIFEKDKITTIILSFRKAEKIIPEILKVDPKDSPNFLLIREDDDERTLDTSTYPVKPKLIYHNLHEYNDSETSYTQDLGQFYYNTKTKSPIFRQNMNLNLSKLTKSFLKKHGLTKKEAAAYEASNKRAADSYKEMFKEKLKIESFNKKNSKNHIFLLEDIIEEGGGSGVQGGNIEFLPTGDCLIGTSDFTVSGFKKAAEYYCPNNRSAIAVPTNFLEVGHADEVIRSVPIKKNGDENCKFAVQIISPKLGIDLLYKNKDSHLPYKHLGFTDGLKEYCDSKNNKQPKKNIKKKSKTHGLLFNPNTIAIFPNLYAQEMKPECNAGTLIEFLNKNKEYLEFNLEVQKKMDSLEENVQKVLKQRLPNCNISIIKVPTIFNGRINNQSKDPLEKVYAESLFPALVNSLYYKNHLLTPDTGFKPFNKYFESAMSDLNVKTIFKDPDGHNAGYFHCETNPIRIPESKKLWKI